MAGGTIGSGAVMLSANADALAPGLAGAKKQVQTWGKSVSTGLNSLFSSKGGILGGLQGLGGTLAGGVTRAASAAKGLLGGAGGAIGFALGGPIGAAVGSAVGNAVGSLGETVAGALAEPFTKIEEFGALTKQATSLGIGASQFQGLTQELKKVGIEGDQVSTVFAKLGNTLTKASMFNDPTAQKAIGNLGLDFDKLANEPLDQAFLKIATAISELGSAGMQAHAAISIFGKAGAQLLPTLQKGGAGIQSFIDSQKSMGAVLSDSQLQASANAAKAWKGAKVQISAAWDGLVNRATVIAAPIIEFAGKAVQKAFTLLTPVFDWVGRAVGQVADIAAAVFEQLGKWIEMGIEEVKSWGAELGVFTGQWPSIQEVVVMVFRSIGTAAAFAWDSVKFGTGIFATVAGTMIEQGMGIISVFRTLTDLLKDLPDSVKPEWLDSFVAGVDKADDRFRSFGGDVKKWGKDAVTSWGQSAQQFNDWLDRALKPKVQNAVKPVIPPNMGGAAMPAIWQPAKLAGAVEEGTKEAYSIKARAIYGEYAPKNDADDVHKKNGKKLDQTNEHLSGIEQRLKSLEENFSEV